MGSSDLSLRSPETARGGEEQREGAGRSEARSLGGQASLAEKPISIPGNSSRKGYHPSLAL